MTNETFLTTPVTPTLQVKFLNKVYNVIGVNFLSGTIRLKGQHENLSVDFSQCEYLNKK